MQRLFQGGGHTEVQINQQVSRRERGVDLCVDEAKPESEQKYQKYYGSMV
jgi:hypothetical protein